MKAIIMAGGEGVRLRPLTCDRPKPMACLMDRPVMAYTLALLKHCGITECAVTLKYLPDRIRDAFMDGAEYGVALRYYEEECPMGTAGGIRRAQDFLDDTFCVLSGDGVTDCDLQAALEAHRASGALATLVLKRVENPLEYGVVVTEPDGKIRAFLEKPGWGEVCADTVNTGIYIMEPALLAEIPKDKPYDFGQDLFPALLAKGAPIYGWVMDGYWCDIGDISAYLRAHYDLLDGRFCPVGHSFRPGSVIRMPGAVIDRSAILEAPCFIGNGAHIGEGARIGPYSVIGAGATVGAGATIKRSVLYPGAHAEERAQLRGCVLDIGAIAGRAAGAFEDSVIGEQAQLGARATLLPGVKIWPHRKVGEGVRVDANLVWGGATASAFQGMSLSVDSPAQAARDAAAVYVRLRPSELMVARSASATAYAMSRAVIAGLMAQGARIYDAGETTLPQLRFMQSICDVAAALYVTTSTIIPLRAEGAPLSDHDQRAIDAMIVRQDAPAAFTGITHPIRTMGASDIPYIAMLAHESRMLDDLPSKRRPAVAVFASGEPLAYIAEKALIRAGFSPRMEWESEMMALAPDEIGIWLDDQGETAQFHDVSGPLSETEQELLYDWVLLQRGETTLYVPFGATRAVNRLSESFGAQVEYGTPNRADAMGRLAQMAPNQFRLRFDGMYFALVTLNTLLRSSLTLSEWRARMPERIRRHQTIPLSNAQRGRVLTRLTRDLPDLDAARGFYMENDRGSAWIQAMADTPALRVTGEGLNEEYADELCAFLVARVNRAIQAEGEIV